MAAYPQPAPAAVAPPPPPAPVPESVNGFKPGKEFKAVSEATAAHSRGKAGYQRGRGSSKAAWIGVAVALAAGLVVGVAVGVPYLKRLKEQAGNNPNHEPGGSPKGGPASNPNRSPLVTGSSGLPRRLLFIQVSNYLYLNPLTTASMVNGSKGPDLTLHAANRLAHEWRVPRDKDNNQAFVVSDKEQPMKPVMAGAIDLFLDTCRPQDRIVMYYGGHVFTKKMEDKEEAFLVPMEGDPEDVETLIPVADVFAKVKACKATQKVIVWDVCRYNPERGRLRPGSEPMSEAVAKLLTEPAPAGVQVILTCQPGENALEYYNQSFDTLDLNKKIAGSAFLDLTRFVKGGGKNLGENDPIPVDDWAATLAKKVIEAAALASSGEKGGKFAQTVKVYGSAPQALTAANKDEAPAKRFEMPAPPKGASVADLVAEFALPPITGDDAIAELGAFPFPADALAAYKADVSVSEMKMPGNKEKYSFQLAVIEGFETMRDVWGDAGRGKLRDSFTGVIDERLKKEVGREQDYLAVATPRIEQVLFLLEAVEPKKPQQSKRWQAHYDYAVAHAKARLAYLHEYNLALGNIKTEVLPARDPKLHDGYRLVSSPTMKVKKEKQYLVEAHEIFDAMINTYKGTPWAIVAKRDRALALGLAWQPYNSKGDLTPPEPPMAATKE
ncbi:MAG: caspase family protein [Gemmataceae bacterium]